MELSPVALGTYGGLVIKAGCLLLAGLTIYLLLREVHRLPLPPGPNGRFPFLSMTFDLPKEHPWIQYAKWADKYGPLMHMRVGLQHFVIISDGQISKELLDRRANIYSFRPPSVVGDILSHGLRSVLMPYGPRWRMVRKLFASILNSTRCDGYIKIQQAEAIVALHDIFKQPTLFADHIHRYSLSVTRSISYGQRVMSHDDPIATKLSSVVANFSYAMTPGRFLVESMPILLRLPRFMNPWLALLERFRDEEDALSLENYRNALERGKKHPKQKTIVKDLQELRAGNESISEIQAATTCAEILQTGADTTANSLVILILACLAFPEVLAKAHEELDRVIGCDRFPTWEDEPNLPYIRAMIKEQHRWNTIAPMSFAHYTNAEDEYNGYRIPKGTVVRINTWAMHHDPERYPEPFRYNPDRFLDHKLSASAYANGSDVAARDHFSYGGGKRICVGMHLAERSLFTMASRLLQTFEIKPALDENGQEIPVDTSSSRFSSSLISVALPFQARFKVRNAAVEHLLEKEWIETAREGKVESWEGVL